MGLRHLGLKGSAATAVAVAIFLLKGYAIAVTATEAMATADLVVAGQKWNFNHAETEEGGVESAVFYPIGQSRDDASEVLILKTAQEDAPYTIQALKDEVDPAYVDPNFLNYESHVDSDENVLRLKVIMKDVPGKTFSTVTASMTGLMTGTTEMIFASYTIGVDKYEGHEKDLPTFLVRADQKIDALTPQEIHDWFANRHEDAKREAAEKAKQS